eukprot:CAMPEP_0196765956 /NCGR_PEP_ID=MMETSP1095-20130614/15810_1 /TAXON_ID=96789 ORGANISM="Chromulina nebulosa, Strain UTEXLB2642" /NCGR_SAMPLE_ID=MMETSP1095 /ASSEMBLY_ACC=CAM_ASM_000446 /LENGTH=712 /DNA_ID=CAMNT_0042125417 /DNA_START=117 /DNA_END=2255 /DNA_ORIENTATION=-
MNVNDNEIKSETQENENNNDSKKEILKKNKTKANTPINIDQSKGSTNKRLRLNKSHSDTIPITINDIPNSKSVRRPSSESTLDTIKASDIAKESTSGEIGTKTTSEDSKGALNNIFLYLGNEIAPNYSYTGNYDAKGGKQSNAKSKSYSFLSSPTEDYLDNQGIDFPTWTPLDVSLKSESLDEFRKVLSNHKINEETESLLKNKNKLTSRAEIDGEFSEIFAHQCKDNQNKANDLDDPKFFDETYRSTINSTSRLYDFHLFEPQLGSISLDEGFGALFKVSSEDWEESTWRQQSLMKHNFLTESINQPIVLAQADRPVSPTTRAIEAAKAIESDIKKANSSDSSLLDLNLSSNSSEGKPLTAIPVLFNPSSDAFLSSMSVDQYNGLLTNGLLTGSTSFSSGLISTGLLTKPLPPLVTPVVTSVNSTLTNDVTSSSKSTNGEIDKKQVIIDKKEPIVNEMSQPLFKSSSYQDQSNNPTNVYNNFLYTNYNEKLANYMSMNGIDADGYSMFNPYITKTIGLNSLSGLTLDSNFNPMSSNNSSSANRGRYRCGRCGQPKVNHNCVFGDALTVANVQIQTVTIDECIINEETMEPLENEKFMVISSSKDISKSIESSSNKSNSPQLTGQSSNYLQSTSHDSGQSSTKSIGRNQQIYLQQYCQLLQMQQLQMNNQSTDREKDKTTVKIDETMSPSLLLSLPIWPQQMSTSTTSTDNK